MSEPKPAPIQRIDWREPASMDETRMAHDRFRRAYVNGSGCTIAMEEVGLDGTNGVTKAYLAKTEPFMPWSRDFCKAVFAHCREDGRSAYLRSKAR